MNVLCILIILVSVEGALSGISFNGNGTDGVEELIGGDPVGITEAAYMVVLTLLDEETNEHEFRCAGVLYKPDRVITSAACVLTHSGVKTLDPSKMRVYAGTSNLWNITEYREVKFVKAHPDYETMAGTNDVGVVKVKSEFELDETVRTIGVSKGSFDIPLEGSEIQGGVTACIINGWGCNAIGGLPISDLRQTGITIFDKTKCIEDYVKKYNIPIEPHEAYMCVVSTSPKYYCLSDPGGPLICDGSLIAVFTFSEGCTGDATLPCLYTQVHQYEDWINIDPVGSSAIVSNHSLKFIIYSVILQFSGVVFYQCY